MLLANDKVKEVAEGVGFDLVGVCGAGAPESMGFYQEWLGKGFHGEMGYLAESVELRADLNRVLEGVQSVVMVGLGYYQEPLEGDVQIARYALGRDYHKVMRGKMKTMVRELEPEFGGEWRAAVDSAPLMERELAMRAGLGWFGKNTMLINTRKGSWFMIGCLLTTVGFESDKAAVGGCGSCKACVEACPTGAIMFDEGRWQVDARKCISYLTIEKRGEFSEEESGMVGEWAFGCDVCQEVCPFNEFRENQPERGMRAKDEGFLDRRNWPGLERLRVIGDEEWDELTRGSAVRRAGVDGLRRNAQAALRNRGGGQDGEGE